MATMLRLALAVGCLQAFAAGAGEIIILQPAPTKDTQVIQVIPEGSGRSSERAMNRARREAGKATPGTTIIITDEVTEPSAQDNAEEAAQSAGEYLRPAGPPPGAASGGAVILRSLPMTDSERSRQRARAYVVPAGQQSGARSRDCVAAVNNQVGTVGEGSGSAGGGVLERGSSNVNLQSYCR